MNITKKIVTLLLFLFTLPLFAEEISVEFKGVTWTMDTSKIENDVSISLSQKRDAISYLKGIWEHGNVSPNLWQKKISSPQGFDYKTDIFWDIKCPTGTLPSIGVGNEWTQNFITHSDVIDKTSFQVMVILHQNGDSAEVRLSGHLKGNKMFYARSECPVVNQPELAKALNIPLRNGRQYAWGDIKDQTGLYESILKIHPKMKAEIESHANAATPVTVAYIPQKAPLL